MSNARAVAEADTSVLETIGSYFAEVTEVLGRIPVDRLENAVRRLEDARWKRQAVYVCGNGGSAATSIHFASDLAKGALAPDKPAIKARSLCENTSLVTAWANDVCYDEIFTQCVEPWIESGDVLVVISGSGNSQNVIKAVGLAKAAGATTIGLTGFDGGRLKDVVDICVLVPSNSMEQVEDVHLLLCHLITTCLRGRRPSDSVSHTSHRVLITPRRDLAEAAVGGSPLRDRT